MLNTKEVINPLEKYMQSHMLAIAEPHHNQNDDFA